MRAAIWILAGLALLLLLAWGGIPPLARWQIEARGTEMLGRAVHVERVRFLPWKLQTILEGLEVAGLPGSPPQLRVDRVQFRTALSSLWEGAPVIEGLAIEAPQLRLARLGSGHYDIDDLVQKLATPQEPARPAARYVLRNLRLSGGTVDFEDRAAAGVPALHTVRELQLSLPAISSLSADREGEVAPVLAFTLDGSRFDSQAQALPFAELRKGEATLKVQGLDLARLRGYWPAGLPLQPKAGMLDAELTLRFAQAAKPADTALDIAGSLHFQKLALQAADGREALSVDALQLDIAQLAPLHQRLRLDKLEITGPKLDIARDAAGRIDLMPAAAPAAPGAASAAAAPAWQLELARLVVHGGQLRWGDASVGPPVALALQQLELDASAIAWPQAASTAPAELQGSASLAGPGSAPARLEWSGTAAPAQGRLQIQAAALPLAWARPYLQGRLRPDLRGTLALQGLVGWNGAAVTAEGMRIAVDDLALVQNGKTLAGAKRLALQDLRLDTARRSVSAATLELNAPVGLLARDARGGWNFADWWATPTAPGAAPSAAKDVAPAWTIALAGLQIDQGRFGWRDASAGRPVALDLSDLRLRVRDLAWPMPRGGRTLPLELDSSIAAGQTPAATLRFRGSLRPDPLLLDGRLDASRLPLQALEPYIGDRFNVQLVRADLGFAGSLRAALAPAGLQLEASGQVSVENGRVDSAVPDAPASAAAPATTPRTGVLTPGYRRSNSLFTWKTLQMRNATLRLAPGKPLFWGVHEITLGDFFARLAINENGRLNLRDLTRTPAAGAAPARPAAAAASAPAPASDAPELHFGQIHFANGRVQFTDNFIKPSYSASLSELEGVLGAFDSVGAVYAEPAMATLALHGKAEGTATLNIEGKLNPLANPLAIDLVAKVDDLDLPALSPYSVKYMGHGIQRGKLGMSVHYRIEPDGHLTADNSLVLRQLVFDEEAQGGSSLPVRLAAALLADRNGVIDLNLPISGSINDPQFSLAPVIGKALVNLVVRAVTSPFSLISSVFSGGAGKAESSTVAFAPGSAELDGTARQGLDTVADALKARPQLQLTIAGSASLDAEQEAMRRERLRQLARGEKRRALIAAAPAQAAPPLAQVTVSDAEYPALLRKVYASTDMPKPRNFIGMAKDVPVDEMERLLSAQVDVDQGTVRNLALQRGGAVRDYLAAKGVPVSRVFLGAVRLDDGDRADWKPGAQLRLSAD
ncbi:DUF748 domain-containing protein [Xylophilus rhododendri]|uniref:DUF748 domain-containing protein n=1 Tax=Xylophilus rhododendri TaxID=2697032 RepID=A0A857J7L5_9BURK|nr:DUF748 domain-containing protein [Xylophilus rhododendri]QHJ00031.1 DUF748 domain-containing protein [Xylophilus rhododendri]